MVLPRLLFKLTELTAIKFLKRLILKATLLSSLPKLSAAHKGLIRVHTVHIPFMMLTKKFYVLQVTRKHLMRS
jgi:hypothetical protein